MAVEKLGIHSILWRRLHAAIDILWRRLLTCWLSQKKSGRRWPLPLRPRRDLHHVWVSGSYAAIRAPHWCGAAIHKSTTSVWPYIRSPHWCCGLYIRAPVQWRDPISRWYKSRLAALPTNHHSAVVLMLEIAWRNSWSGTHTSFLIQQQMEKFTSYGNRRGIIL